MFILDSGLNNQMKLTNKRAVLVCHELNLYVISVSFISITLSRSADVGQARLLIIVRS